MMNKNIELKWLGIPLTNDYTSMIITVLDVFD